MEIVSPQTIREVEFREKLRGYNPDEVDEFLERVAAGVEILQERLRQATDRAIRAEASAKETLEGDESLRRTLVLAQRTADLAVQEAKDQAARIVDGAEAQAQAIALEAHERARRLAEEAQAKVWADLHRLEAARDQLRQDIATLARYLETERKRAQITLAEAARRLEEAVPAPPAPPPLHEPDISGVETWDPPAAAPAGYHEARAPEEAVAYSADRGNGQLDYDTAYYRPS